MDLQGKVGQKLRLPPLQRVENEKLIRV